MQRELILTLVSLFILSALIVPLVGAQSRTVGVTVGEWFKYGDITVNWSCDDPNATIPFNFEWMSALEWIKLTVTDVSGTNITFQFAYNLKNATDGTYEDIVVVDINTGEGSPYGMWAISANLNANDTIYSSFDYSTMKINETIVRTYPDGVRDTNHLNTTAERSGIL